jgi:hypothetical protein
MKALDALVTGTLKSGSTRQSRAGAVQPAYAPPVVVPATFWIGAQTPDDLKGLGSHRTDAARCRPSFIALGAEPRTMTFAEAQAALEGGKSFRRHARDVRRRAIQCAGRPPCGPGARSPASAFSPNRAFWAGCPTPIEQRQ